MEAQMNEGAVRGMHKDAQASGRVRMDVWGTGWCTGTTRKAAQERRHTPGMLHAVPTKGAC
eukprot:1160336-Pelagomonas_calceolata.AAC.3